MIVTCPGFKQRHVLYIIKIFQNPKCRIIKCHLSPMVIQPLTAQLTESYKLS